MRHPSALSTSRTLELLVSLLSFAVSALPARAAGGEETGGGHQPAAQDREAFRAQVESDWILREGFRAEPVSGTVTTRADAAGGCDGIKDGAYGFHTGLAEDPWWQVDLGSEVALSRAVIWNRCDGAAERASHLRLLLSVDGKEWRAAYAHGGAVFLGAPDGKPLSVDLTGGSTRFLRIQLPGTTYLHLDEVEVFGPGDPLKNLALGKPADQSSTSQWSREKRGTASFDCLRRVREILAHSRRLAAELLEAGADVGDETRALDALSARIDASPAGALDGSIYFEARWIQRRLTLRSPLLDFDAILFAKQVPSLYNHMSDQYIGWWSRPGGGICIVRGFKDGIPRVETISGAFKEPGSFLRPELSYDGTKVLFAWCKHSPGLAGEPDKLDKANVPEDAFYHVFEMRIDGSGVRRLTSGKYDDFDARYLPDGRIVFLSTRRGQSLQVGRKSAARTLLRKDLGDVYVRCGGGPDRPCVVYTLHTMDADGGNLIAISPFEMFEWTPSVARDGTILYSRWDYIDRDNMPFMGLWAMGPDGSGARLVYKNFTRAPHCTFEPRCVPGSGKIVFTASAHHAQTLGSLVLLDPAAGTEGPDPIVRLTPEVAFPEAEGWPKSHYAGPWPLSERLHLVTWGCEGAMVPPTSLGWDRWHIARRPQNGMGIYLLDAAGNMELLYRDPEISSTCPIPLEPRERPPVIAGAAHGSGESEEGRFLLSDVYRGLDSIQRGEIKALRIVAVPAKTHPTMNYPSMGITGDDPGKCVLGTVPVEEDGSAHFRAPAGVIVFFQTLDSRGMAAQTMRSVTYVQPGRTLGCAGCHEPRSEAPRRATLMPTVMAARREASRIAPGPEGSWPLRFDKLVQPVLEKHCVRCHGPASEDREASRFDLTPEKSYASLTSHGSPSLADHVRTAYRRGYSVAGSGGARESKVLEKLAASESHRGLELDAESLERLIVWMDTYAQRLGSFSAEQEREIEGLRREWAGLLAEREAPAAAGAEGGGRPVDDGPDGAQ